MANEIYFTNGSKVTPHTDPSAEGYKKKNEFVTQTEVYEYQTFANDASQSSQQFAQRVQEWNDELSLWKRKAPDAKSFERTKEYAQHAFQCLVSSKTTAEDRMEALSNRLAIAPQDLDAKQMGFKESLETYQRTLQVACESMNRQLPLARLSLNQLLGFG